MPPGVQTQRLGIYYVIKLRNMDLEQEKELVEKAQNDISAFGVIFDEYYQKILGYVLKRTADIETARDITSEVFVKALNNLSKFQWKDVPFSAWLYRIANNETANHYRKNGRKHAGLDNIVNSITYSEPSSETELLAAEAELEKHRDFLVLRKNIAGLPVKYQEVIVLRFFEKKPVRDIAGILGKREGTVKSLLHRGLKKLRDAMERNATFQNISGYG